MSPDLFQRRSERERRARKEAELLLERKSEELYETNQQLLKTNQQLERQTRELLEARDAALESSRVKSAFLANMSHEIRTPMNGALGMIELVLDSALTAEQREYLTMARDSAQSLLEVINDILDLSKIEAGSLDLESVPFSPCRVVSETFQLFALPAKRKGLAFVHDIAPDIPEYTTGDPTRLRQVLINLIGNAIKFTSRGEVSLRVCVVHRTADQATLHFAVRDTGIGIAAEKQTAIFNPFTQVDGSITRRFGGTGLGLSIAAKLAEKMQGHISVESTSGAGSTFSFTAVVKLGPSPAMLPPEPEAMEPTFMPCMRPHPLRILVAEDNPVNQRLTAALLRREGHDVLLAANGREAVEEFAAECFDAILMDIQMPVMDGYEATAAIRRQEQQLGAYRTPILALTAHAMTGDREQCLSAGMDDYVSKPIRCSELTHKLARLVARSAKRRSISGSTNAPTA